MRIFNVMFGKELGGIEQAFLDYSQALSEQGHQVISVVQPDAAITQSLSLLNVMVKRFGNISQWDPFATSKLNNLVFSVHQPDVIITHGNRATKLMKKAANGKIPVVAVTHNYNIKDVKGLTSILAITDDLYRFVLSKGVSKDKIYKIPNMIDVSKYQDSKKPNNNVPVIGTMGRFVKKKGFDVFLTALSILKKEGVNFNAVIGGSGPEEENLNMLCQKLELTDRVEFTGWVTNKSQFFDNIDLFCLPSISEPFGIILLEAFVNNVPVVSSASEGPSEIIKHGQDGLLFDVGVPEALAIGIKKILDNKKDAEDYASNARQKVTDLYSMKKVSEDLSNVLVKIVESDRARIKANMLQSQYG